MTEIVDLHGKKIERIRREKDLAVALTRDLFIAHIRRMPAELFAQVFDAATVVIDKWEKPHG